MSAPEILRHSGPHTVELNPGNKDASRRHGVAPQALPTPLHLGTAPEKKHSPHSNSFEGGTQLIPGHAESNDNWMDDPAFSERLDLLRARNRQMTQSLRRLAQTTSREDTHE